MAVYCPLWHSYDHMDAWKGIGWNEWQLVKNAKPRFKGHYQPIRPTWGPFDESDPKWAAKEIDLAADHGIDVFMIDWYWYSGVKIMEEALERGFLRAPNRRRIKFALMWANHDWADYFPAPHTHRRHWNQWLPCRYSAADLHRMIDHCAERYFAQPNYWRMDDGSLFFSVFDTSAFVTGLGGPARTRRELARIERRFRARGLPPIHWNGMTYAMDNLTNQQRDGILDAGFHSATSYNVASTDTTRAQDHGVQPYPEVMKAHRRNWRALAGSGMAHFPVVTLGWDATPRCLPEVPYPFVTNQEYPYWHVVTGNTPARFGQLCRDARQHIAETPNALPVVMVNAWNEWTEGCYLLPEKRYGLGYLRALRDAFGLPSRRRK
jgi:hypothetical protein